MACLASLIFYIALYSTPIRSQPGKGQLLAVICGGGVLYDNLSWPYPLLFNKTSPEPGQKILINHQNGWTVSTKHLRSQGKGEDISSLLFL